MATIIQLPDCAKELLAFLYPAVDWSRVAFFSGLPWYAQLFSPNTDAITLPDPIGGSAYRIYLGSNTDFCLSSTLETLVHEAFHIQQFMSIAGGYGAGFFRPGFIGYLICFMQHGFKYDDNPYEIDAYAQESAFRQCNTVPVCDCSTGGPVFNPAGLDVLKSCNPKLIIERGSAPSCGSWWSAPLGVILAIILAVLGFLGHLLDRANCTLLKMQQRQCSKWGATTRTECQQWADQGYSQCTTWADEGYSQCTTWADEGYSACSQWSTQASSSCCTWWPCSWGCKALVWVFTQVCTATVWVANLVCKVTVWIANIVCTVSVWIANVVCILWSVVTQLICLVWTTFWRIVLFCW